MNQLSITGAPLPAAYQAACQALAECEAIDECKQWTDKAIAMKSYARQSKDSTLLQTAVRIQLRALARCGELLDEFDGRPANALKQTSPGQSLISQRAAAEAAGLSEYQQFQAVAISRVPTEVREALIESGNPPTAKELADMGRNPRPLPADYLGGRDPDLFNRVLHSLAGIENATGLVIRFAGDIEAVIPSMTGDERMRLAHALDSIDDFTHRVRERL